jgi:hypothetical protein
MYRITAQALDGFAATHRAWSRAAALSWVAQYPAHVADTVTIRRFGRVIACRIAAV